MVGSRVRRFLILPLAAALPLAGAVPAQASTVPGWHVKTVLSTGTGNQGFLLDVSSDAPGDAWAVGLAHGTSISPLIAHWNGTAWSQVTLPASVQAALGADGLVSAVSAGSPKNVWAFGAASTWAHYDGATWTSGQLVKPGSSVPAIIASALALSKINVWAFGSRLTSTGGHAYAAHFNGVKWTATSVPGTGTISDASTINAGDIWAVEGGGLLGGPGGGHGALVHWSGGAWHSVILPKALVGRPLSSVVASSDKNVWVAGALPNSKKGTTEAVGHWNGSVWKVQVMPVLATAQKFAVSGMASDGHGGLWATANCLSCTGNVPSRMWHESAGSWKRATVASKYPLAIVSMALAPGTTSVWGVGGIAIGKTTDALIALDGTAPH
ncbi:MAG TPA: hypothetical protein VF834_15555 [Streptosporangiaceae bacterium]